MESFKTTGRPSLVLLVALVAIGPISTDLYLPSLADMTRVFATDVSSIQLTLSVFVIGFAVAQLVYGPLSDGFGRRPVMLAGMSVYLAGCLLCTFAPSVNVLLIGRFLQAVGGCSGPVLARAVVRDVYPPEEGARILATTATAMALGPALAPFLGGYLHAAFGWQANFVVLSLFAAMLLVAVWRRLGETNRHKQLTALSPTALAETYARLARDRTFLGHTWTLSLIYAAFFAFLSGSSFVLIDVLGVRPQFFGFCFIFEATGFMGGSFIAQRFTRRVGMERMVRAGVAIGLVGGLALLGLAWARIETVAAVMGPVFVVFLGGGMALPNGTAAAIAPHARVAGSASALLGFVQGSMGAGAGWLVGRLHNGTTLPMAAILCATEVLAGLGLLRLSRKPS